MNIKTHDDKPSSLVPYPNPEKVDREFYDLHGIPYPESTPSDHRSIKRNRREQVEYQKRLSRASGEKTCVDCHKGVAHRLPDMRNVEGWQ